MHLNNRRCHGCDRISGSMLTANCGHKTCFYCIKANRSANRCKKCANDAIPSTSRRRIQSVSPIKHERSTEKNETYMRSQETRAFAQYSPARQAKAPLQIATDRDTGRLKWSKDRLVCPEHQQPFSMYCKKSKQILCSMCLCKKINFKQQILPLRNAEEFLRKENKACKQQARIALGDVENAWRIVNKNRQVLEQSVQDHTIYITNFYQRLIAELSSLQSSSIKMCREYIETKMKQYGEISDDLSYLMETLKEYHNSIHENNTLNQSTYLYTSYKAIRGTIDSLTFNYISHEGTRIKLIDYSGSYGSEIDYIANIKKQLSKFQFNLPIKSHEQNKSRSTSLNSVKNRISPDGLLKHKHKIGEQQPKKHKFSLCSNASLDLANDENTMYKKLLKAKYNR